MYTEYQIRSSVIKALKQALSSTGITGYVVMARNQPRMTNDDNVVLLDKLNTQRIGWQGREYWAENEHGERVNVSCDDYDRTKAAIGKRECWIERITFQVSVIHKRHTNDTLSTMTGEDVAKRLQMWMNSSDGAAEMRSMTPVPFAPFFISQTRSQTYSDDSDIHQTDEQFDFGICVVQSWDTKPNAIEDFEVETHPI